MSGGPELARLMARRGIRDERVLAAVAAVPRELFVPEDLRRHAYADRALPIGCGQTISQPFMVATMLDLASAPKPSNARGTSLVGFESNTKSRKRRWTRQTTRRLSSSATVLVS